MMIIDNMRRQGYFSGPMGFDHEWQKMVRESYFESDYKATDPMLMA